MALADYSDGGERWGGGAWGEEQPYLLPTVGDRDAKLKQEGRL
jgi:hypothetical protein